MLAHNELGTLQPVKEIATACRERQIPMICDAVQAVGKIEVDVGTLGADFVAAGAHKFHGPLGVGALWVRSGIELNPLLVGGGHEGGRRASTPATPLLVGFGRAAHLARVEMSTRARQLARLRDRFELGLSGVPEAVIHCAESPRLPNTSHIRVPGVSGRELAAWLDRQGFAISTGAACKGEPTAALAALGLTTEEANAAMRISFGIGNRESGVDSLLAAFRQGVEELRSSRGAERGMIGPS
jgi:cysteine desulfurase